MSLKNVDVRGAERLQNDGNHTYVDVRSVPEFERGHPAGARNVPLLHLDPQTGRMQPNPEFLTVMRANFEPGAKLLVGCQMGGRSAQAGQMLVAAGYEDVTNVVGGYGGARDRFTGQLINEGWADAGLPVEQGSPAGCGYDDLRKQVTSS